MKKLIILPAALLALSLSSCKKDYTCTCTSTGSSSVTTIVDVNKATAKANCVSTTQTSSGQTYQETCTLSK
ncbi:MAG TPA: hypothetical protein PLQ93_07125 [Bacteroidia bacterium]|nr:hypothetical protein [Bacteroidia bacterium]